MEKYIATIMQRHYLGENSYIYNSLNSVLGTIDPKTRIFKDLNGNEYSSITDKSLMYSEIPYGYANLIPISRLEEVTTEGLSRKEAIAELDNLSKEFFYYIGKNKDNETYVLTITKDELVKHYEKGLEKINEKEQEQKEREEEFKQVAEEENKKLQSENSQENEEYDDVEDMSEMSPELADLTVEIINGMYSFEELEDLFKQMEYRKADLESVADTIKLQMEATLKGESAIHLRKSDEEYDDFDDEADALEEELQEEFETTYKPFNKLEVKNKIKAAVKGQDEAIDRVVNSIYARLMGDESKTLNFLTGPSGCGKTEIWRQLSKCLGRDIVIIDAGQLTSSGYVGRSISEELYKVYDKCGRDMDRAENAIVIFDELDKKSKNGVAGTDVLEELLGVIEGTEVSISPSSKLAVPDKTLNTENIIFGATGAFSDVFKNTSKKGKTMGFNGDVEDHFTEPTEEDYKNFSAMPAECIDRCEMIAIKPLTKNIYKDILLNSTLSPIKNQIKLFAKENVELEFSEDYIDERCAKAEEKKESARVLGKQIRRDVYVPYDECTDLGFTPLEKKKLVITKDIIEDPIAYAFEDKEISKTYSKKLN